jgi:hypothetical protein
MCFALESQDKNVSCQVLLMTDKVRKLILFSCTHASRLLLF